MDTLEKATAESGGAQSVDRALMLLSLIGRHCDSGASLASIVEGSGLNRPTARRLVLALMRSRLVEQDPVTRRYFLGEEAYVLGVLASHRFGFLDCALESLAVLSRKSGDTSFACVRRGDHSVCLHREEGAFPIRTHALLPGHRHPLGVGAGAMAMLAALDDGEIGRVLAANGAVLAERYLAYTPEAIEADVAFARRRGFALNPGRVLQNSWAIGMAARYPDGRIAGALSIAAIDSRMGEARQGELAHELALEVAKVEARLERRFRPVTASGRHASETARAGETARAIERSGAIERAGAVETAGAEAPRQTVFLGGIGS
ncbi:IclR family transcriptional regulator [Aurantimonas sp. 22II-16-19i]|uniref:IclR family transcriptional regulator n=1 Tax=Aurantimonas sp. 22II-16-19i TaxID=1317114 RepID=UPI0009F7B3D0|nr:IclR family transcriptional regulator [Aurantimonas sp. 22II-16-19i]ORE90444.1 Transcription regulator IclR family protein [Aurantimonas sp. 22II-16-19i]